MANLAETLRWEASVYQIETTDPVLGGPVQPAPSTGGISNRQALALANRTLYLKDQVEKRAPLASPALTGAPTAPTPTSSDNSTKIATTAFVKAVVAALVDSSPSTLDTLNELAAALGDDPNFATTMATALAAKAPLASPEFTGTPKATTPPRGDNSTRIATTAHVAAGYAAVNTDGEVERPIALAGQSRPGLSVANAAAFGATRQVLQLAPCVPPIGTVTPQQYLVFKLPVAANAMVTAEILGYMHSHTTSLLSAKVSFFYDSATAAINRTSLAHLGGARLPIGVGIDSAGQACIIVDRTGTNYPAICLPYSTVSQSGARGQAWAWQETASLDGYTGVSWLPDTGLGSYPRAYSITALPTSNIGPITVIEAGEIWTWSTSAHFSGYRSPLCGRPVDGHTIAPLASEVDAVGGLLSKTAYAALWGYARENGLVVTQSTWDADPGAHLFVDVSTSQFRVPDLRNQVRRYAGTDADTATARTLGSTQKGSLMSFDIGVNAGLVGNRSGITPVSAAAGRVDLGYDRVSADAYPSAQYASSNSSTPGVNVGAITNSAEIAFGTVRMPNVGYHPRIHI